MNHLFSKVILFIFLGAFGCLLGWIVGEPWLYKMVSSEISKTTPTIAFDPEIQRRLDREGGQRGAVTFSLKWNNTDDLDLHAIGPSGEEIYFANKKSTLGGELDVDMNVSNPVNDPVENIRWLNVAPEGKYQVFVDHYNDREENTPTEYKVQIEKNKEVSVYSGSIKYGEEKKLINEFTLTSNLEVHDNDNFTYLVLVMSVWTIFIALGLSYALVAGQNRYMHKKLMTIKQFTIVTIGAVIAGFVSGGTSQIILNIIPSAGSIVWLTSWSILGLLIGAIISFFIPNLARKRSAMAGAVGGVIGALAFISTEPVIGNIGGRLVGTMILGSAIGLMLVVIEKITSEAYLEINWNPKEKSVISLGNKPIVIGSSNKADIYLTQQQGMPLDIAEITLHNGEIEHTDNKTGKTQKLHNGSTLKMGKISIVVRIP